MPLNQSWVNAWRNRGRRGTQPPYDKETPRKPTWEPWTPQQLPGGIPQTGGSPNYGAIAYGASMDDPYIPEHKPPPVSDPYMWTDVSKPKTQTGVPGAGPGGLAGKPYSNLPGQHRWEDWYPQGNLGRLGWNADMMITEPTTSAEQDQSISFLNWANQILPFLTPSMQASLISDMRDAAEELVTANVLARAPGAGVSENTPTLQYYENLANAANDLKLSGWYQDISANTGRSKLQEFRNAMASLGQRGSVDENAIRALTRMIDRILAIWPEGQGAMTRAQRNQFWNEVNDMPPGIPEEWQDYIQAIVAPSFNIPTIQSMFGMAPGLMPSGSSRGYSTSNYGYY